MRAVSSTGDQPAPTSSYFRKWVMCLHFGLFRDARHFNGDNFSYCGIFEVTCVMSQAYKPGLHLQAYSMDSFFANL